MKRILLVLAVMGLLLGAVYGSAASLNVEGGTIQGGKDTTLACQSTNDVDVVWKTCAGGGGDARIFGLELSGFDTACNGCYVLAYLLNDSGNFVGSGDPGMWRASAVIAGGSVVVDQYYDGTTPWVTASCGHGPRVEVIDQVHLIIKNALASSDG